MKQDKITYWENHIGNQQVSNLSVVKYCEEQGLKVHQFLYWKRKSISRKRKKPEFIEILPKPKSADSDSGTEIKISLGFAGFNLMRFELTFTGKKNEILDWWGQL